MSDVPIRKGPDERFSDWSKDTLAHMGPPQCSTCIHRFGNTRFCAAFPDGIPAVILGNRFDHHAEYPGDHGIRYEPALPKDQ